MLLSKEFLFLIKCIFGISPSPRGLGEMVRPPHVQKRGYEKLRALRFSRRQDGLGRA